jgi:hypothetical protein
MASFTNESIPDLLSLVRRSTSSQDTKEQALITLRNKSGQEASARMEIVTCNGIHLLISVLKGKGYRAVAKENALATLSNIGSETNMAVKVCEDGTLPILVQQLKNGSTEGKERAAAAIGACAISRACVRVCISSKCICVCRCLSSLYKLCIVWMSPNRSFAPPSTETNAAHSHTIQNAIDFPSPF